MNLAAKDRRILALESQLQQLTEERDYFAQRARSEENNGLRMRDEGNATILHLQDKLQQLREELARKPILRKDSLGQTYYFAYDIDARDARMRGIMGGKENGVNSER